MALFGAPLAHEDHAIRACYAALRMQEAVKRYAEEVQRRRRAGSDPRGVEFRRSRGARHRRDLHMDYTAVGQSTHLAARIEQARLSPVSILHQRHDPSLSPRAIVAGPGARHAARQGARRAQSRCTSSPGAGRAHAAAGFSRVAGSPGSSDATRELEQLRQALAAGRAGPRSDRRGDRRGRRGEISPLLRVRAFQFARALADSRKRLRLLRPGHRVPSRHRSPPGLFPASRTAMIYRNDPGEGDRQAALPGRVAEYHPSPPCWLCSTRLSRRIRNGRTLEPEQRRQRTLHALKQLAAARESGSTAAYRIPGSALDRF